MRKYTFANIFLLIAHSSYSKMWEDDILEN